MGPWARGLAGLLLPPWQGPPLGMASEYIIKQTQGIPGGPGVPWGIPGVPGGSPEGMGRESSDAPRNAGADSYPVQIKNSSGAKWKPLKAELGKS